MEEPGDGQDDQVFKYKGPPCTRCGLAGHSEKRCRRPILREKCGSRCEHCADMKHRRDKPVCLGCGKPWEPEVLEHKLPTPRSGCHGF